jgi:hypothetical protein
MDYGAILSRAWKITWNNKILWLFGFFAGSSSVSFRGPSGSGGDGGFTGDPGDIRIPREIQRLLDRPEVVALIIGGVVVLVVIAIALFILSMIARGGLIGGIRLADDNGKVTFGEAWAIGLRYFWRMLGMTLALAVPVLVIGIVLAVLAIALGVATFGLGVLCVLPLVCVFVILYIPYSVVIWLGQIGVVVDDLGVVDGIKRGWELLKANIGPVVIVGVLLFVIGLAIGFVLVLPLVLIATPLFVAFMADPENPNMPLVIGSIVGFLCLLPFLWVLGGIINTWTYSVWTLTYRQITGNRPAPLPAASEVMQPA